MAHVQGSQPCPLAGGQEVAPLKPGQLFAAPPGVAEHAHERQVARTSERIVGDPRLGLGDEPLVLAGAERLRRLALGALGARQPDGQRRTDLRRGHMLVLGQPTAGSCSARRDPS